MIKKKPHFQRTQAHQYSKLGRRRKKKQKYRRARGLDNKMRLNHKGKPSRVLIGHASDKRTRGLIDGKTPVNVSNITQLRNIKKNEVAVISKIGRRKRMEIMKYAVENKIQLIAVNPKKAIERMEEKIKVQAEEKKKRKEKKKSSEKKKKEAKKEEKNEKVEKENEDKKTEEKNDQNKEIGEKKK